MFIIIQGDKLFDTANYTVRIGNKNCTNTKVISNNMIICEPPRTRPDVAEKDYKGYNKIPVKVSVINTFFFFRMEMTFAKCAIL